VYLTEFFATYLFGIHEVMRMRDNQVGLYALTEAQQEGAPVSSGEELEHDELGESFDDPEPEMEKNIFALKIFLPSSIKEGLQYRANKAQVPLGRFARAMICAHLFGRDVGPIRLMNWTEMGGG
jgi:hypothetical protein